MAAIARTFQRSMSLRETSKERQELEKRVAEGGLDPIRAGSRDRPQSRSLERKNSRSDSKRQALEGLSIAELKAMAVQADKDIKDFARSRCKKKAMEEMKRKQRIEKEIARLEGSGLDDKGAGGSRTTALLDVCDEKVCEEEYEKLERQVMPGADAEEASAGAAADASNKHPELSLINAPELPDTFRRNSTG